MRARRALRKSTGTTTRMPIILPLPPASWEMHTPRTPRPPDSPNTGSPAPRRRQHMQLLASVITSPNNALSNGANLVVRGLRNRFFFGANNASPNDLPAVSQLPAAPNNAANALWSPTSSTGATPRRESRLGRIQPLERNVRGLFSNTAAASPTKGGEASTSKQPEPAPPAAPSSPIQVCCICLDDMDTVKSTSRLSCPQCTMCAHSRCLSRWFESEAAALANRPRNHPGTGSPLTKSTATCPNCRGELDWDALALQVCSLSHIIPLPPLNALC